MTCSSALSLRLFGEDMTVFGQETAAAREKKAEAIQAAASFKEASVALGTE